MREEFPPTIYEQDYEVEIPYEIRDQHIYVPGGTRRGKSSQLLHLIMQDINNGCGVAVLDPKGDLVKQICFLLPPTRVVQGLTRDILDDCIYLDLKTPIPLDFMGHRKDERDTLIGELVYIVTKGDANLPAAEPLLRRALRSLLSVEGTTFLDVYRFFSDKTRRQTILDSLAHANAELHASWDPFPTDKQYGPITSRMENFYWDEALHAIFGSSNAALNIGRLMDERRIILVNLAPITNAANRLYGALLVSKFQQAALRRSDIRKSQRIPFFLYVDEFECFQTDSFASIFSMAGGLGLRLTIGNQYLDQLDSKILSAVVGNAGSYIIFQLGPKDIALFKNIVLPYDNARLEKLRPHQAVFKIGSANPIFKWTRTPHEMSEEDEDYAERVVERLKERTIAKYGSHAPSAESGPIRTADKPAVNGAESVIMLEHDVPTTTDNADTPTVLLPNRPKTADPRKPR